MAQPQNVPQTPAQQARYYSSPPRRPDSWRAERPGDLSGAGQPSGPGLGAQGPDQGYILKLEKSFAGALTLAPGEVEADAIAGCRNVALKRASVFGRAPVMHDLSVAFNAWGFLGEADPDLVAVRKPMFEGVANTVHHYLESRRIVDAVPERILRMSPQEVADTSKSDWRSCLDLDD